MSDVNAVTGEIAIVDEGYDAAAAVEAFKNNSVSIFSSIQGDNFDSRLAVIDALTTSIPLNEHYGENFELANFVSQAIKVRDENGDRVDAVRTVLIAADGTAYSTVADGVVRSLQDYVGVLGMPHEWPNPVPVQAVEVRTRNGYRTVQLQLARAAKGK